MILNVKVTTKASQNSVIKIDDTNFKIKVTVAPEKGKANATIIKLLSDYFHIAKSRIKIISGMTSRNKKIEITNS